MMPFSFPTFLMCLLQLFGAHPSQFTRNDDIFPTLFNYFSFSIVFLLGCNALFFAFPPLTLVLYDVGGVFVGDDVIVIVESKK